MLVVVLLLCWLLELLFSNEVTLLLGLYVLLFKDSEVQQNINYMPGKYIGRYSRVDLSDADYNNFQEFLNSVEPLTDTENQAHREYSSHTSGADIAQGTKLEILGNSIHALHDDSLQDITQDITNIYERLTWQEMDDETGE